MYMDLQIIKDIDHVLIHIDQVRSFADTSKNELGFLPAKVYFEQANRGYLWVVEDSRSSTVAGYLLFGGRYPGLKIFQLYVGERYRGKGVGEMLINELVNYGTQHFHQYISARVAVDLAANSFWNSQKFQIVSQVREEGRRAINIRMREIEGSALFGTNSSRPTADLAFIGEPILRNSLYLLDLNVYFDVVKGREHEGDAQRIFSMAMSNSIRLAVTTEFTKELEQPENRRQIDPVLRLASTFPVLPDVPRKHLDPLRNELRRLVFPNRSETRKHSKQDHSDLTHLAIAIHHKSGFITRENAILRKSEQLRKSYNIEVLSPSDFADPNYSDSRPSTDVKTHTQTAIGHIQFEQLNEGERASVEKFLVKLGLKENQLMNSVAPGDSTRKRNRIVAKYLGEICGYASWFENQTPDPTCHIYVDEASRAAELVIDNLLQLIESGHTPEKFELISLRLSQAQPRTYETVLSRGFRKFPESSQSGTILNKWSYGGLVNKSHWSRFREDFIRISGYLLPEQYPTYAELFYTGLFLRGPEGKTTTISLREFETMTSSILACEGRKYAIVPIREGYARQLFRDVHAQSELFATTEALLRPERAYFLQAGKDRVVAPDSVALFYVSGHKRGPKEVVGLARITYSETKPVEAAQISLVRQGVLEQTDLKARANSKGNITAITFDNFFELQQRVSFQQLKSIGCITGANLITAQSLSHKHFNRIVSILEE